MLKEKASSPDGTELWLNWVVFLRGSTTAIGTFQATLPKGESGSIAYIVFPPFWRKGYAREMSVCVLNHLFDEYDVPSLSAEIDTRNESSIRLAESIGLHFVKTTHNVDVFKGHSSDEHTYSVSRDGWYSSAGSRPSQAPPKTV